MKRTVLAALLALLFPLAAGAAPAAPATPPAGDAPKLLPFARTVAPAPAVQTMVMPLYKLAPFPTMDLKCSSSSRSIFLPIPDRWDLKSVKLHVHYINSTNLITDISQLAVLINDNKIGQTKLDALNPESSFDMQIPVDVIDPAYNSMVFRVAQHFLRGDCEVPCAPDLWTTVNLQLSYVEVQYSLKPLPLNIGDSSSFVFDQKMNGENVVNLVLEDDSDEILTNAGIVASGIARKFNYRPVRFTVSREVAPGGDNVLIGKKAFAEKFLARSGFPLAVNDPFIQVLPRPLLPKEIEAIPFSYRLQTMQEAQRAGAQRYWNDPYHALYIISGLNNDHLMMAAETFAVMNFPFPGGPTMMVHEFSLPSITLYSGKNLITPEKQHRFRSLDLKTHTFRGMQSAPAEIIFRLPADFLIKQNEYGKLTLNFAYGAGLRTDSALNIALNGTQVRAINLDNDHGDSLTGYKVELPTYLFKPGTNVLRFEAILTPQAKECDLIQPDSFFLTVFDNSTFFMPAMPHLIELPKMELMFLNGFPFTRWPDGYETFLFIAEKDPEVTQAALNLVGAITQKNGYPLFGIRLGYKKPEAWKGELMVVGTAHAIPEEIMGAAPLQIGKVSKVPYPLISDNEGGWSSYAVVKETGTLGANTAAIMEFESPYEAARTVFMATALTPDELHRLSFALLDPGVQNQIEGSLALIGLTPPDYRLDANTFGKRYLTGKKGKISPLDNFIYNHPYIYYITAGALFAVIAGIIYLSARRLRKQRAAGGEEGAKPSLLKRLAQFVKKIFLRKKG